MEMRGRQRAWCPVGRRRWKLCPDGQMRHDQRAGPGGGGVGRASSVPCTSMCRMPCGYFYSCQGNSVIYGRPGPLQGCVINTPGPTLLFTWKGSSGPVLCGLSPASLPGLTGSCPHVAFLGCPPSPPPWWLSSQSSEPQYEWVYQMLSGVRVVWKLASMSFEFGVHTDFKGQAR